MMERMNAMIEIINAAFWMFIAPMIQWIKKEGCPSAWGAFLPLGDQSPLNKLVTMLMIAAAKLIIAVAKLIFSLFIFMFSPPSLYPYYNLSRLCSQAKASIPLRFYRTFQHFCKIKKTSWFNSVLNQDVFFISILFLNPCIQKPAGNCNPEVTLAGFHFNFPFCLFL